MGVADLSVCFIFLIRGVNAMLTLICCTDVGNGTYQPLYATPNPNQPAPSYGATN